MGTHDIDFSERFEVLSRLSYRAAHRILGSRSEAEEVAQGSARKSTRTLARSRRTRRAMGGTGDRKPSDRPVASTATQRRLRRHPRGGPGTSRCTDTRTHGSHRGCVTPAEAPTRGRRAEPGRDLPTGLNLPAAKCAHLDGATTLALIRSRHFESADGTENWTIDPTGDLGRIARTQAVLIAAFHSLGDLTTSPLTLDGLSRTLADHAIVDSQLSLEEITRLGRQLLAAGTARTSMRTLPVATARTTSNASVLDLAAGADALLSDFGAPATAQPKRPAPEATAPATPLHSCP